MEPIKLSPAARKRAQVAALDPLANGHVVVRDVSGVELVVLKVTSVVHAPNDEIGTTILVEPAAVLVRGRAYDAVGYDESGSIVAWFTVGKKEDLPRPHLRFPTVEFFQGAVIALRSIVIGGMAA